EGRADVVLDQLDRLLARADVDARVGVGEALRVRAGPLVAHDDCGAALGSVRSSTGASSRSFASVPVSATGTGDSFERHAVQNDSGGAPVAWHSRSSSR